MLTRSLLGSAFVLLAAVAVSSGGCATGGQVTNVPEGGPPTDSPSTDTSGCASPKIMCGSQCVDPTSDNANCGGCKKACPTGEVCGNSKCGLTCSPGQTLCSGAPFDGGSMPDATSDTAPPSDASMMDVGAMDGGMMEASAHDASHPEAGHDAGKSDAGLTPYCANLNNDPKNCGVCGKACAMNETCDAGECVVHCTKGQTACPDNSGCAGPGECCTDKDCMAIGQTCPAPGGMCTCPPSQTVCPDFETCIPNTSCCTDKSCTVTGETCPTPGGSCTCPSGQSVCTTSTTSLCIATGTCCTDSDCSVTGETCSMPGGSCACPTGDTICTSSNSCISSTACCTASDCTPLPAHVMSASCTGGVCGVATCVAGYVNVDGTYSDGCECQDDVFGKSCSAVTSEGSVDLGQTINITGLLPIAGEQNWFEVTFPDYTAPTFHAKITLSTNPGSQFLFNVYDPSCADTALPCGDGGNSTARTTWEMSETDTNSPIDTFPTVGSGGVVYVEVYRASGAPTCSSYVLTISD
jgi:hypothetical protein